jgi:hypothetical protein
MTPDYVRGAGDALKAMASAKDANPHSILAAMKSLGLTANDIGNPAEIVACQSFMNRLRAFIADWT